MSEDLQYEVMMKCGHSANSMGTQAYSKNRQPACVICGCFDVADNQPNLEGRKARCAYFGKEVKRGSYNGNCCDECGKRTNCECERPSALNLWFFEYRGPGTKHYKGEDKFDQFYCACQGAY